MKRSNLFCRLLEREGRRVKGERRKAKLRISPFSFFPYPFAMAVLLIGTIARAQPAPPLPPGPMAREKLEALRIWRLTDELKLTEDQSAQFFPKLKQIRELRDARRDAQKQLTDELSAELQNSPPREATLKQVLDSLQAVDDNFHRADAKIRREISQILTVEQQARLLVFQANFERQTRRVLKQIERDRKPGPGKDR